MKNFGQKCVSCALFAVFAASSPAAHAQWKPFQEHSNAAELLQKSRLPTFDFYAPKPVFRPSPPPPVTDYIAPWDKLTLLEKARMLTVKVGMTRGQLLDMFQTPGGIRAVYRDKSSIQVFEYRTCRSYKVRVEFAPTHPPVRDADGRVRTEEDLDDVIVKISPPFLGPVYDD